MFFPSTTTEWNNLNHDVRNSGSYTLFRSNILKFIRPSPNSFHDCQNIMGIKLVTRLHLGLSHLREHKFKHSFQDTLNLLCICRMDVESSTHFLLQCPLYINGRRTFMRNLNRINPQISQTSLQLLTNTLLFGNPSYSNKTNTHILSATIDYIRLTKRFDEPYFCIMRFLSFLFIFLTNLPICTAISSCIIFFRLRLNFILFYFNYNCNIIVFYLLIVSCSCILLTGGRSMNQ